MRDAVGARHAAVPRLHLLVRWWIGVRGFQRGEEGSEQLRGQCSLRATFEPTEQHLERMLLPEDETSWFGLGFDFRQERRFRVRSASVWSAAEARLRFRRSEQTVRPSDA